MIQEVHVQVPVHLKQYLKDEFGSEELRVFVDRQKPLGQYITSLLDDRISQLEVRRFNLVFLLDEDAAACEDGAVLVMSERGRNHFVSFIEHIMLRDLFSKLDLCLAKGIEMKKTILEWIERYDLVDSHWNYDTLTKAYYRERKRTEEEKEHKIRKLV